MRRRPSGCMATAPSRLLGSTLQCARAAVEMCTALREQWVRVRRLPAHPGHPGIPSPWLGPAKSPHQRSLLHKGHVVIISSPQQWFRSKDCSKMPVKRHWLKLARPEFRNIYYQHYGAFQQGRLAPSSQLTFSIIIIIVQQNHQYANNVDCFPFEPLIFPQTLLNGDQGDKRSPRGSCCLSTSPLVLSTSSFSSLLMLSCPLSSAFTLIIFSCSWLIKVACKIKTYLNFLSNCPLRGSDKKTLLPNSKSSWNMASKWTLTRLKGLRNLGSFSLVISASSPSGKVNWDRFPNLSEITKVHFLGQVYSPKMNRTFKW